MGEGEDAGKTRGEDVDVLVGVLLIVVAVFVVVAQASIEDEAVFPLVFHLQVGIDVGFVVGHEVFLVTPLIEDAVELVSFSVVAVVYLHSDGVGA